MYYTPHHAPDAFDRVVRLESWAQDEDHGLHLVVSTAKNRLAHATLTSISPYVWRFKMTIPEREEQPPTPVLIAQPAGNEQVSVKQNHKAIVVSGSQVTLTIEYDPFCILYSDREGNVITRENPADIDGLGRPFVLPLGFVLDDENPCVTESFHLRPDEHFWGLGEKFTPLDKRGQKIISWTQDAFGSTSERSHKNIPFLISTRGYGVWVDTGAKVTWDMGTTSSQSYTISVEGTTLDLYWIYGPSPAEIIQRYSELTGFAPVPPRWSFGLWLSGAGVRRDRESIEAMVDEIERREFPLDVIHVDTWWMKWRQYMNYQFDPEAFPNPEALIAQLHDKGLKLSVWEQPYISIESPLFEIGKREGYFLTRPDGEVYIIDYGLSLAPRPDGTVRIAMPETSWNASVAIVDLSHPQAFVWYQDLHRPLLRMGLDVFKTDFGEDIPVDAVFANGQTGKTMHNLYPLLYNQAVSDVTDEEKGYRLVWSRSGTAGNQRYPVCWSADPASDWDSLAATIRGGLSIGFSGVPFWSSDIGGYRGMPSPALYTRWAQFTMFCSHARMHGDSAREPWSFGEEAYTHVRKYVELRYQLFPYLYSAAIEASRTGMPVIRAMALAFPDDVNTYDKDLQFMFGPSLLVAPIYDESGKRSVYLPRGQWIDFHTGHVYAGETNLHIQVGLDTLPVYIKGGAFIPKIASVRRLGQVSDDAPLVIDVYPEGDSEYTLHDDMGDITFHCAKTDTSITITWRGQGVRELQFSLAFPETNTPEIQSQGAFTFTQSNNQLHIHPQKTASGQLQILTR